MKEALFLLSNLGNLKTSKIESIVLAQGEGAEALKGRALEKMMGGMEVLGLMAAASVPEMIGALLMMITRTTAALQETVMCHSENASQLNWVLLFAIPCLQQELMFVLLFRLS